MRYGEVVPGRFLERPNRFIARVELNGKLETVHVKNTGRCRELLVPDARVYLSRGTTPGRKTAWDLIAVEKQTARGPLLVNMDAQAPNAVFYEWAAAGGLREEVRSIRREAVYGNSRLDFLLDTVRGPLYVEVKGVTLEHGGKASFPDAPTERGVKHVRELRRAAAEGLGAALCFVVQMEGMDSVSPNDGHDPAFGAALRDAAAHGVQVWAWECAVKPDALNIVREVPVIL